MKYLIFLLTYSIISTTMISQLKAQELVSRERYEQIVDRSYGGQIACSQCHNGSNNRYPNLLLDDTALYEKYVNENNHNKACDSDPLKKMLTSPVMKDYTDAMKENDPDAYIDFVRYIKGLFASYDPSSQDSSGGNSAIQGTEPNAEISIDKDSIAAQRIIFKRCYGQMVRERVNTSSTLYKEVSAGTKTGVQACMELFDMALLDSNGRTTFSDNSSEEFGKKIFQTFFEFHISWFGPRTVSESLGFEFTDTLTDSFHDLNQPAYYLSKTLFDENTRYDYVLTADESLRAIRSNDTYISLGPGQKGGATRSRPKLHGAEISEYNPTGDLRGITTYKGRNVIKEGTGFKSPFFTADYWNENKDFKNEVNPFEHFGGGILGSQSWLILNGGPHLGRYPTGAAITKRVLSFNYLKQMLCREAPLIRYNDAKTYTIDTTTSEGLEQVTREPGYRSSQICMQCHATLDPFAWSGRNLFSTHSNGEESQNNAQDMFLVFIHAHEVSGTGNDIENSWPDGTDSSFYKRPPHGRLFFREHDGDLIDQPVEGFEEMGSALAATDAPYVCAAKRYFQFFTGIKANVDDVQNIGGLSKKEIYYRNFVIKLGQNLKENQSLRTMIENIFTSKAYLEPGLGVE